MKRVTERLRTLNPWQKRALAAGAVVLLLGWLLGQPPQGRSGGADDEGELFQNRTLPSQRSDTVETALASLYRREVWSIPTPSSDEEADGEGEEADDSGQAAPPEGLERFALVALVRVAGRPEALLLDEAAQTDQVFRVGPGDRLRDSQVTVEQIGRTTVTIKLEERTRTLKLYPRPEETGEGDPEAEQPAREDT